MNRIEAIFTELKNKKKKAFIPYIMAGYPTVSDTLKTLSLLEHIGADIVELGVPFTDPLADGPVIQAAASKALEKGITLRKVIDIVRKARKTLSIPIVLMTYYNPVFKYGLEFFFENAKKAGIDGLIVPDLPPDEANDFISFAKHHNIATIFLLAPTSTEDRIRLVCRKTSGFVYYVSITGITGSKLTITEEMKMKVSQIKKHTQKAVCIGFGVKKPSQAKEVSRIADGVIVGSSIVKMMAEKPEKLKNYLVSLRKAI